MKKNAQQHVCQKKDTHEECVCAREREERRERGEREERDRERFGEMERGRDWAWGSYVTTLEFLP